MLKARKIGFLTLVFVMFLFIQSYADDKTDLRLITVTGEGEVKVIPDEVVLTLGVETSNTDLNAAKNENDQKVQKIISAAKELGIPDKYIQTDYINIEPRYKHEWKNRDFIGYFVRKKISITLKEVSKFEALLSSVLNLGANFVLGVDFRTTELRKYRDQARSMALKAAQGKANALGGQLGQVVGKPHAITEGQNYWWTGYSSWWGARGASQMTQNVSQDAATRGNNHRALFASRIISQKLIKKITKYFPCPTA
ncbi:MAG: SIMPL domain-containing protein [Candidatus Omnitrophota bacterium]